MYFVFRSPLGKWANDKTEFGDFFSCPHYRYNTKIHTLSLTYFLCDYSVNPNLRSGRHSMYCSTIYHIYFVSLSIYIYNQIIWRYLNSLSFLHNISVIRFFTELNSFLKYSSTIKLLYVLFVESGQELMQLH